MTQTIPQDNNKYKDISPQYLAGLLDSDGSLSLTKRTDPRHSDKSKFTLRPIFQLTWSNKPECVKVLNEIAEKYNGNVCEVKISGFPTKEKTAIKINIEGIN